MTRTTRSNLFVLLAIVALVVVLLSSDAEAFREQHSTIAFAQQGSHATFLTSIRGGSAAIDVEIESSDEEETDEEEEEEIAPKLAKSTKKAANKAVKKSVAAAMKPKKKKKFSLSKLFRLPYIVKACLNPVTFFQMTAGYWKSLYNINYMSETAADSSQDLRSALEQKARYGGGKKPSRGKRKMKPGQAKTLSDLPQLNT